MFLNSFSLVLCLFHFVCVCVCILDGLRCQYTPSQSGIHEVSITHDGEHIPSSPFRVEVVPDVSETMVTGDNLKSALVTILAKFQIKISSPTSSPVTAVVEGPTRYVN